MTEEKTKVNLMYECRTSEQLRRHDELRGEHSEAAILLIMALQDWTELDSKAYCTHSGRDIKDATKAWHVVVETATHASADDFFELEDLFSKVANAKKYQIGKFTIGAVLNAVLAKSRGE